ncbi:FAD dependent oxidoreductase [Blastocladiella britannica]|nr:FAD dependent oxidoreductase [Blastocladiella britannica]
MATATRRSCLVAAAKYRYSTAAAPDIVVDTVIVGGGAIGLATAVSLSSLPHTKTTVALVEAEPLLGRHASSRNSEVIHAGLYYPPRSLRHRLCLRGKDLLYQFAKTHHVHHVNCGKWVVATAGGAETKLGLIHDHARAHGVPVEWVPMAVAQREQPNLAPGIARVLSSPSTGIIDSAGYLAALRSVAEDNGVHVATRARVVNIYVDRSPRTRYLLTMDDGAGGSWTLAARSVVNAAGAWAPALFRSAHLAAGGPASQSEHGGHDRWTHPLTTQTYPARGHYFALRRNNVHKVHRLLYPIPDPLGTSLGIHATVDLAGRAKFGPSVEWPVRDTSSGTSALADYSPPHNGIDTARAEFARAIAEYLDGIDPEDLEYDYVGVRPKISGPGEAARDFYIADESKWGLSGWINCLGVESPGLTSSLAVGEMVAGLVAGRSVA